MCRVNIGHLMVTVGQQGKLKENLTELHIINTRISRLVTIVTRCHNCDLVCHNCDIPFAKILELKSEIIPKN